MTLGSLFSGGGGWELAGVSLGLVPRFGVELDPVVADHYVRVFGDLVCREDVTSLDFDALFPVRVLAASPPCQPTSKSGAQARARKRAAGLSDAALPGSLCDPTVGLRTVDAAATLLPRAVVIENSDAYLKTRVCAEIIAGLRDIGYTVDARVLDAADHGAPSSRRRTIIRAVRGPLRAWPETRARCSWLDAIRDLIAGLPVCALAPWQAEALRVNPAPAGVPLLIAGGNPARNSAGYVVWRTPDQPSWVIQKAPNVSGMRVVDAEGVVRRVSPRVVARLMGFPDTYPLPDDSSRALSLMGNAIPYPLACAILASVL